MSITSNVTTDTAWSPTLWPGVALVTGAGSGEYGAILSLEGHAANCKGIGAAVAKAFAEAGCRALAITDIDDKKLISTKDYIISKHEAVTVLTATGDIADEKFVQSFVNGVVTEVGRLDFAVRYPM